jgi:hypothetical protein
VALLDVIGGSLRLIRVAITNFRKNRFVNLVPGQLQNLAFDIDADVF